MFFLLGCLHSPPQQSQEKVERTIPQACLENGECVFLEIADSPEEREVGLMNRTALAPEAGMLFIHEESGRHYYWMKNTLIPLDIIWIEEKNSIVQVSKAVPCNSEPCPVYAPDSPAKFVLEVNAGFSEKNGLREGQKIVFKNIEQN